MQAAPLAPPLAAPHAVPKAAPQAAPQTSEVSARGGATTVAPPSELEKLRFGAVKTPADAQVRQGGGAASGSPQELGAVDRGATARQGCWVPARCCDGSQPVAGIRSPGAR